MNALPELNVMMDDFSKRIPSILDFCKEGAYHPDDPNSQVYKEAVLNYSAWARERIRGGRVPSASEVAAQHDIQVLKRANSRSEAEENDPLKKLEIQETQGESYELLQ